MSAELINNVIAQGYRLATHSWEYGAFSEALLEWYNPQYSVFGSDPFPLGKVPVLQVHDVKALSYVKPHIWTNQTTLVDGDGAAGDPASLGVFAVLIGQTEPDYLNAAGRQMDHLLTAVPRWPNGAISHREAVAELWADFLYMAPPALAYWAVQTADAALLAEVLRQCSLYRDVLGVPKTKKKDDPFAAGGLWHHIIVPPNHKKKTDLEAGIRTAKAILRDILDAALALDAAEPREPLLRNYLNDTTWFGELAGTTLLASTVYRLAVLVPEEFGGNNNNKKYVAWADAKRPEIVARVDSRGLLAPVVNPLGWGDRTPHTESPEAQSFAVLMFAAWRDYQEMCQSGGKSIARLDDFCLLEAMEAGWLGASMLP
ncbi:uncharacterized protein PG998_002320 [Apiospora kogelbergensis]|uniref:uncharacterized protein n=1 Tax=Apiospora kogelbergensis TaxID=1337665 RepID=UPI00312D3757